MNHFPNHILVNNTFLFLFNKLFKLGIPFENRHPRTSLYPDAGSGRLATDRLTRLRLIFRLKRPMLTCLLAPVTRSAQLARAREMRPVKMLNYCKREMYAFEKKFQSLWSLKSKIEKNFLFEFLFPI